MGKAAIINPYLDTLGGGENYTINIAKVLIALGYSVDIEWGDDSIKNKLQDRFGINLDNVNIKADLKKGDGYDICFWISDGSIPMLHARNNILHFQIPFKNVDGRTLYNKMKLFRVNNIVCNSVFTKRIIDEEYGVNSTVIYPPINTNDFKPKRKENIILYVGRFSVLKQEKHQDILIDTFKKLYDNNLKGWKLVLAGGVEVGAENNIKDLKKLITGYPIEVIESPKRKNLIDLFGKAKIFWSASGYAVDEYNNPEKVEHFGMTVVEAMSSGCVPIVYNAGGHREIVNDNNGYVWSDTLELIKITNELISNPKKIIELSRKATSDSKKYDYEKFRDNVEKIL